MVRISMEIIGSRKHFESFEPNAGKLVSNWNRDIIQRNGLARSIYRF